MKHLVKFALLVATLTACVILYCFVLAWLCLCWAQTLLFTYTSALLDRCLSKPTITTETNLGSQ